jgi:N-terminal half of MaoC dehydratase
VTRTEIPGLAGLEAEPFALVVETGKIREFARATRAEDATYFADDPVIPPTFLMAAAHWSQHELELLAKIPGEPRRRLHGEQEFVFPSGPPRAGTRLHARSRVESAWEREGRRGGSLRIYVLATEYRRDDDTLAAVARMTVVEVEHAP